MFFNSFKERQLIFITVWDGNERSSKYELLSDNDHNSITEDGAYNA